MTTEKSNVTLGVEQTRQEGEPMGDVSYRHSDLQRIKEVGGWIVGAIFAVVAASGWGFKIDRDIQDGQRIDNEQNEAITAVSNRMTAAEQREAGQKSKLEVVDGKLDLVIGLLQGGATESPRPSHASRR